MAGLGRSGSAARSSQRCRGRILGAMGEPGTRAEKAKRATRTVFAASQSAARASASAAGGAGRVVHRMTRASGAGRTGLSNLIELTAAGNLADAFVAVALAGTPLFWASVGPDPGKIALGVRITK